MAKVIGAIFLIIIVWYLIDTYTAFFIIVGILAAAGIAFYAYKASGKGKRSNKSSGKRESPHGEITTEYFPAVDIKYYLENITRLAVRNDSWGKSVVELLADGKAEKPVFRHNFINKPVELVPEPDNAHDPNAVAIQIAGKKVGYIKADEAAHVKDILLNQEVAHISAVIYAGEYRIPHEDGTETHGKKNITVKVRIAYRAKNVPAALVSGSRRKPQKAKKKSRRLAPALVVVAMLAALGSCFGGGSEESLETTIPTDTAILDTSAPEITEAPTIVPTEAPVVTEAPTEAPPIKATEAPAPEEPREEMVWISQSGSKYHSKSTCSNMNNPSKITKSQAIAKKYTPCKKCH